MNEARGVALHVPPELDPVAGLEPHRMRVIVPASERGENRQPSNSTKVGQHLDGAGLTMVKGDSGQSERVLHHDPPNNGRENSALAKGHLLSKLPAAGNTVGHVAVR